MSAGSERRNVWIVWGVVALLLAPILAFSWRPLVIAWNCYWLHENAPREQARVMHKLEEQATFALLIEEGPHAGQGCTADTSRSIFEATQKGDLLPVVYVEWKPGECELESTIEASAWVLWSFIALLGFLCLLLIGLGAFLHRTFRRPRDPRRRMPVEPRDMRCPVCGKAMDEGYVPLLAGLHWRRIGDPVGLPHALHGLPGTVGWRERPRLHAFRCVPCEIVTLQYGEPRG
jgi:hypothetical protein